MATNGILLRPFPYREPDRLVKVETVYTNASYQDWGYGNECL